MSVTTSAADEYSSSASSTMFQHPYLLAVSLFMILCLVTRIRTGSQARYNNLDVVVDTPRSIPVVPYSIPLIGHTISFGVGFVEFLKATAYRVPSGIFALKIGGGTHNIVVSPSLTKEILNRPSIPIDQDAIVYRFLTLSFGDRGAFKTWNDKDPKGISDLSRILHGLMRDPFLSDAVSRTIKAVEEQSYNFISGNPSWVDQSPWERAGNVEILSASPTAGTFVAEANLFAVTRDFVGNLATSVLFGRALLENNPNLLQDLWLFDKKITILMMGLPTWFMPGVPQAIGARNRLTEAVREHHRAMIDLIEGKDPGYKYDDLTDVSPLVWDRVRAFHKANADGWTYGVGDMVLLWAMNVNANHIVFWMLYFLYSQPSLIAEIRSEISPFVSSHQPDPNGLPIKEAPQLQLNIDGLFHKCPLLKGAMFETMRLQVSGQSYRYATADFTITESKEDALKVGKTQPDKFLVKKGDIIAISSKVHQDHPLYYESPEKFDAKRFWVKKTDEKGEEQISVEYGNMRPWGGGKGMCKGRNFAEREVLAFVAGIITMWDMDPVSKDGWKHPGNVDTAGTFNPKKDIRVRIRRRER